MSAKLKAVSSKANTTAKTAAKSKAASGHNSSPSKTSQKAAQKTSKKRGVTRDSIIDAGLSLFAEKGFDGTSVKDLEAAVGLTPGSGSFYRHFKSKEDLMEEVIHREVERVRDLRALQSQVVEQFSSKPRERLAQEVQLGLAGMNEIESLITLLGREYGNFPNLMKQLRELLVDESLDFRIEDLSHDMKSGKIYGDDARALSAVLLSASVGYHLARTFFGTTIGDVDEQRFAETLASLVAKD